MTTAGINDFCSQPKTYPSTTRYDFTKKARVRAYQLQVIFPSVYRVSLVVWQLGWVDLDLDNSPGWMAAIVATYCQSRMVEHHLKSESTQPDSQTTWDTLYLHVCVCTQCTHLHQALSTLLKYYLALYSGKLKLAAS